MANSADPDQLASSEANWSGSTLFSKAGYINIITQNIWISCMCTNSEDQDQTDVEVWSEFFCHIKNASKHITN